MQLTPMLPDWPLHHWILAAAAGLTAGLMATDMLTFKLPNKGVLALALLYPIWVIAHPEPVAWAWALTIAGIALAIGMALFALNLLGAGDAKFAAVAFLWAGLHGAPYYFIYFVLLGGMMSVVLLILRILLRPWKAYLPRLLRQREPVAYGLAIGGGLLLVWSWGLAG